MTTATSSNGQRRFGPYSRAIQRGVVSDVIDGRSREGKYLRRIEAELAAQLGGTPSFAQKLLIRRISRMMLRLEEFDRKLDDGRLTELDVKVMGGLQNAVRLSLRDLGLKASSARPPPPSLADYVKKSVTASRASEETG